MSLSIKAKVKNIGCVISFNFAKKSHPKSCTIIDNSLKEPFLLIDDSTTIKGPFEITKHLCSSTELFSNGQSDLKSQELISLSVEKLRDARTLPLNCDLLNQKLGSEPFFVGPQIQAADIFIWSSLFENSRWKVVKKQKEKYKGLINWYEGLEKMNEFSEAINFFSAKKETTKGNDRNDINKNYNDLNIGIDESMRGRIITRFPPEPSGFLHIGHVKAVILNSTIAEMWGGKMILRFDDTNPSKEKGEYVENITKDLETIGVKYWKLTHTSDYFGLLLRICTEMILAGRAFVDDCTREIMKEERMARIESKNRDNSVEKNMEMWEKMQKGEKLTVRIKLDMKSNNGCLRDPVMYRVNTETSHLRSGERYKVYPTYDYSIPIVDTIEGVTNSFRTSEYQDRGIQYKQVWGSIFKPLNKGDRRSVFQRSIDEELKDYEKPPNFSENLQEISKSPQMPKVKVFSRLRLMNTLLSKRKLNWFVETGRVASWDDPRFPTVQGILRRGLTVEGLKQFTLMQGFSCMENLMSWDKLWSINKKVLDPIAPRYTAISERFVKLTLKDGPEDCLKDAAVNMVRLHPKYPERGLKAIRVGKEILIERVDAELFKENDEVTLVEWGNVLIEKIDLDRGVMSGRLNLEGDVKKTLKVTWLADSGADLVKCSLVTLSPLITVPKLEDGMNVEDYANEDTWKEENAFGDPNLRKLKKGDIIQLQRKGFAIVDQPVFDEKEDRMRFIMIPDSKNIVKKKKGAN